MKSKFKGNAMLMLTALIWGTAFVAQKSGMELLGPFAFNGIRTVLGGIVLLPVIWIFSHGKNDDAQNALSPEEKAAAKKEENKNLIIGGICCGLALMIAGAIQQIGLIYTTAGKAAFITPLYVVIVPFLSLFLKKKIRPVIWGCVIIAIVGLYMLCMPSSGGFGHINKGDIITLGCAFFFAVHILVIDHFSPKVDGVKLSCIQFFVAGILTVLLMFPLDPMLGFDLPTMSDITGSWFTICYAGIMSCGIAYTLQVVGQKYTDPTSASMIMCLESVFGVLAGMILLGEMMSGREALGCVIMFAAIVIANIPTKEERLAAKSE